jgi:hypothetical protein
VHPYKCTTVIGLPHLRVEISIDWGFYNWGNYPVFYFSISVTSVSPKTNTSAHNCAPLQIHYTVIISLQLHVGNSQGFSLSKMERIASKEFN